MKNLFVLELFVLFCLVFSCSVLYAEEVYHVEEAAIVKEDLVLIGKSCVMEGTVIGDAVIINGDIDLYGTVNGDAVILGGDIILHTGSRIKGDMVIVGGNYEKEKGAGDIVAGEVVTVPIGALRNLFKLIPPVTVAQLATEEGEVKIEDLEKIQEEKAGIEQETGIEQKDTIDKLKEKRDKVTSIRQKMKHPYKKAMEPVWMLVWGIALSTVIMLFTAIFPSGSEKMTLYLEERPGRSFFAGFLAQILFVPAILFLVLSVLGILLIPLFVLAYPIAWLIALVPCSLFTGKRILRDSSFSHNKNYISAFVGLFMLFVLLFIDKLLQIFSSGWGILGTTIGIITIFIFYLYFTFGLGSLILSRLGTRKP
jgi:hypothetical protein